MRAVIFRSLQQERSASAHSTCMILHDNSWGWITMFIIKKNIFIIWRDIFQPDIFWISFLFVVRPNMKIFDIKLTLHNIFGLLFQKIFFSINIFLSKYFGIISSYFQANLTFFKNFFSPTSFDLISFFNIQHILPLFSKHFFT